MYLQSLMLNSTAAAFSSGLKPDFTGQDLSPQSNISVEITLYCHLASAVSVVIRDVNYETFRGSGIFIWSSEYRILFPNNLLAAK